MREIHVAYALLGAFDGPLEVIPSKYGISKVPEWLVVHSPRAIDDPEVRDMYASPVMKRFLDEDPELSAAVDEASEVVLVLGQTECADVQAELANACAMVQAVADSGAVAIVDLQAWTFRSPDTWRSEIFDADPIPAGGLVRILVSEDAEEPKLWLHTRGLRTFGMPDVSVRGVPRERLDDGVELCNRFIDMQAQGYDVPDGQEIRMAGFPEGMRCRHAGSFDDPEFNNVHFEIQWPDA